MIGPRYGMIGNSPAMLGVFEEIERITRRRSNPSIFILGETGTGKELVAKAIHEHGPRKEGKLFAVDSSCVNSEISESLLFGHVKGSFTGAVATTEGYLEAADKGTLFLDEIGNMPLTIQSKLLRAIEYGYRPVGGNEKKADFHLITASNQSLAELVRAGTFREDLYYRIAGYTIYLPPLRERQEDIPLLAAYFLEQHNSELSISSAALDVLASYHWPGNIRQLRNVIEVAAITTDGNSISAEDIQKRLQKDATEDSGEEKSLTAKIEKSFPTSNLSNLPSLEELQLTYAKHIFAATRHSTSETARILGIATRTVQYWIKKRFSVR